MASNAPAVLVTHPGRQHSHQLATALHEAGLLAGYWTGVPARPLTTAPVLRALTQPLEKHALLPLPDDRVRHCLVEPLVRRLTRVLPPPQRVAWSHRAMGWFDRWCAWRLPRDLDAVVCYENSALHTFQRAKALGVTTILDAASFHHAWQDDAYHYAETDAVHARINRRKDREIALADHVLTVSELARESYVQGGVAPERVTSVPVGCDLERFQLDDEEPGDAERATLTFIFAGHAGRRKGIDLLFEATRGLDARNAGTNAGTEVDARVQVAGGTDAGVDWSRAPRGVERLGRLPQPALAERFRRADCLVLPSRHDSFGMVVVEAMATGLPVIVTEHVGAKEAVTEGESGWVISTEDAGALRERMAWCAAHPDAVRGMRGAARRDARPYSWEKYHGRVVERLRAVAALP